MTFAVQAAGYVVGAITRSRIIIILFVIVVAKCILITKEAGVRERIEATMCHRQAKPSSLTLTL